MNIKTNKKLSAQVLINETEAIGFNGSQVSYNIDTKTGKAFIQVVDTLNNKTIKITINK